MNVVFIGAPGAGKGTQAKKLEEEKVGWRHLSTGDLFRENFRKKTPLAQSAKLYVDRGELVPDAITNDMVESFLKGESLEQSIVFDGWPRNLPQAEALDRIFSETGRLLNRVIFFEISDTQIVQRLSGRLHAVKSGCVYHVQMNPPKRPGFCDQSGEPLVVREDDREDLILSRLKIFHQDTKPLLKYYQKKQRPEPETGQEIKQEIKQGIKPAEAKSPKKKGGEALLRAVQAAQPPEKLFLSILQALE